MFIPVCIEETVALLMDDAMIIGMLGIDVDIDRWEVSFLVEMVVLNITLWQIARICSSTFRACLSTFNNRSPVVEAKLEYVDVNIQSELENKQNSFDPYRLTDHVSKLKSASCSQPEGWTLDLEIKVPGSWMLGKKKCNHASEVDETISFIPGPEELSILKHLENNC